MLASTGDPINWCWLGSGEGKGGHNRAGNRWTGAEIGDSGDMVEILVKIAPLKSSALFWAKQAPLILLGFSPAKELAQVQINLPEAHVGVEAVK